MLLTALNLFPAGQLDGGHVARASWNATPWNEPPAAVGTRRRVVSSVLAMTLALCFTPVPLGSLR